MAEQLIGNVSFDEPLYGITPLHVAVASGNFKMIEFLVENGANLDVKIDKVKPSGEMLSITPDILSIQGDNFKIGCSETHLLKGV